MLSFVLGGKTWKRMKNHSGDSAGWQSACRLLAYGQLLSAASPGVKGHWLTSVHERQQRKKKTRTLRILSTHQTTLSMSPCFSE